MDRIEVVKLVKKMGWKPWGKPRALPGNDSKYQCFRRGNHYSWVGSRYAEIDTNGTALDYVHPSTTPLEIYLYFTPQK